MMLRLLLALALLGAACGDAGAPDAAPPASVADVDAGPGEEAGAVATQPPATAAPPASTATAPAFDGPPAPDFQLPLENRDGTFVLSDAATPVYLTFWAEW